MMTDDDNDLRQGWGSRCSSPVLPSCCSHVVRRSVGGDLGVSNALRGVPPTPESAILEWPPPSPAEAPHDTAEGTGADLSQQDRWADLKENLGTMVVVLVGGGTGLDAAFYVHELASPWE